MGFVGFLLRLQCRNVSQHLQSCLVCSEVFRHTQPPVALTDADPSHPLCLVFTKYRKFGGSSFLFETCGSRGSWIT